MIKRTPMMNKATVIMIIEMALSKNLCSNDNVDDDHEAMLNIMTMNKKLTTTMK